MLEFSPAVKRLLGITEEAAPPPRPSSDEFSAVFKVMNTNNCWPRLQQHNEREQASFTLVCEKVLERREKQVQKAKEHPVYQRYVAEVTRAERKPSDPQTPDKARNYSRRDFDTRVRTWKKSLHRWEKRFEAEKALAEGVAAMALGKAFEDPFDFTLTHYDM
ncbi:stem loop binding protein 2 [Aphelenchoides avenae]|nr:stem loop binding protein 2 [Aphelenchus avenae]